jgi:6-phosphogluconolactonase
MLRIHSLNSPDELCSHLVNRWTNLIADPAEGPVLSFALAGGSTPGPAYRAFARALGETGVAAGTSLRFVATDERWVPDSDTQSNEGMIKACFEPLSTRSIPYQLVSLKTGDADISQKAVAEVSERVAAELPQPFTSVILGMGTDSHIASIFPSPGAIPMHAGPDCLAAVHPQTGQERISLSMPRLLRTKRIWLLITGDEKLRVLQNANEAHDSRSPISVLLHNAPCPVDVFWHPA